MIDLKPYFTKEDITKDIKGDDNAYEAAVEAVGSAAGGSIVYESDYRADKQKVCVVSKGLFVRETSGIFGQYAFNPYLVSAGVFCEAKVFCRAGSHGGVCFGRSDQWCAAFVSYHSVYGHRLKADSIWGGSFDHISVLAADCSRGGRSSGNPGCLYSGVEQGSRGSGTGESYPVCLCGGSGHGCYMGRAEPGHDERAGGSAFRKYRTGVSGLWLSLLFRFS